MQLINVIYCIRFVTKSKKQNEKELTLPVEMEVSSAPGLYFPGDMLYFGYITPGESPITLPLFLLNSAPKHIHIQV